MNTLSRFHRLSIVAGVVVMVLVVAACAIKLREEDQTSSASSLTPDANPLAAELARCRTVRPEQKDALEECRCIWAEQRRQFIGQRKTPTPAALPNDSTPNSRPPVSAPRKDETRLPKGWPSVPTPESE